MKALPMSGFIRLAALSTLVCTSACFNYSSEGPERPAPKLRNIKDAKILKMQPHLFHQKGLCPGLEGKLYANANVQWGESKPVPRNIGSDVDSLQPSDFTVTGPFIKGDQKAHLFPDGDVLKTVDSGFVAKIVYKPDPSHYTWDAVFPPEYSCYAGWFADGAMGAAGGYGGDGGNNGEGTNGTNGGDGYKGETGGQGGNIRAVVTVVATRWYPRLYAVIANNTFFLAPAERELTFGAAGGQGGTGGNGGNGGNGGDQHVDSVEVPDGNGSTKTVYVGKGPAGNGGNGGNGGPGGNGGRGGSVEVTYDSAFPELQRYIRIDVSGGAPGYGGGPGGGGSGGQSTAEKNAQQGSPGGNGQPAGDGRQGPQGTPTLRAGSVSSKFANLPGIAIFGSPQARALAANPPPPMLPNVDQALIDQGGPPQPPRLQPTAAPPPTQTAPMPSQSGRYPANRPPPLPGRPPR